MEYFRPCREQNAIKIAAIAFEFSQQLSEESIQKVIAFYDIDVDLQQVFPDKQVIESIVYQIGSGAEDSSHQIKSIGGIILSARPSVTDEPPISLILRSDALIFTCSDYKSWTELFNIAMFYFNKISPIIDNVKSHVVGMEYYDEFIIEKSATHEQWKAELFRSDNLFISNNILKTDGLWHIHQGFFDEHSMLPNKLLNVIEVNLIDDSIQNKVLIKTQHKLNLANELNIKLLISENSKDYLYTIHNKNKQIISQLLSDCALKSINMDKG